MKKLLSQKLMARRQDIRSQTEINDPTNACLLPDTGTRNVVSLLTQ